MSNDFKNNITNNIKNSIKKEDEVLVLDIKEEDTNTFKIGKKKENKIEKKPFPLYVDGSVQKELEKIVKKTGYSRNELINMMIKHCLDNLKFED